MKKIFILITIILSANSLRAQFEFDKLKLRNPNQELKNDSIYNLLKKQLKTVNKTASGLGKFSGSTKFNLSGNTAENSELVILGSSIELNHGVYPQEFSLKTSFQVQIEDGKFNENLSNLHLSYDRFFMPDSNNMSHTFEAFAFMNRESNQFLNVNSRYQVGGGLVIAHWSKLKKKNYKKYLPKKISFEIEEIDKKHSLLIKGTDSIYVDSLSEKEFKSFKNMNTRNKNIIIKNKSPFRIGILAGVLFEIENISVKDSITLTDNSKEEYNYVFDASSKFRWELRPTLDFIVAEYAKVKIRPLFILPMPWDWYQDVEGEKVFDFRASIPLEISIDLKKNFTLGVNYTLNYDNAPSSKKLSEIKSSYTGYFTAKKFHQTYSFNVGYKF